MDGRRRPQLLFECVDAGDGIMLRRKKAISLKAASSTVADQ
jgi:hypothetical protein